MKLSEVLKVHNSIQNPVALRDNIGDAYLLHHNLIFKNIRKLSLSYGFSFNPNPTTDFVVLPFSQLDLIFSNRSIPYLNNVDVLTKLNSKCPNLIEWDELNDGFRRNFIFHESCHAVARKWGSEFWQPEQKLVQIFFEESFANTCEFFAVMEVDNACHQLFYALNSYTTLFEARKYLIRACADAGEVPLFQILLFCYFYANALKKELSDTEFETLAQAFLPKLTKQAKNNIKKLCEVPFTLDLNFRTLTTGFYLKTQGLSLKPKQLQQVVSPGLPFLEFSKNLASLALQN